MIEIVVIVLLVTFYASSFFFLTAEHRRVKQHRLVLLNALYTEHRFWHKCQGGLGVDDKGTITHFKIGEAEGYDYD